MATVTPPASRDGFQIAIICALRRERDAVEALMEVDFKEQGRTYGKANQDRNSYATGVLGGKVVVLAFPRDMGTLNAATVASDMRYSFKNIKIALVVGVAGGAPQTPDGSDISLGDVIVSTAVIQYDFGRQYPDSFRRKNEVESTLGRASTEIANFLAYLDGNRVIKRLTAKTNSYNQDATQSYAYPGLDQDCLFPSNYRHKHHDPKECEICGNCKEWYDPVCERAENASCHELGCDKSTCRVKSKPQHTPEHSLQAHEVRPAQIHFGRVASGNGVIKSGFHRDKLIARERVIGFEMEGAGTWDQLPTLIVKSVCDYADSHKNKGWQDYAAATAASCAKAILEEWELSDQSDAHPSSSSTYLPFSKNRRFVGRTVELETLERKLFVERDCDKVAIVGLGGIGKTQVALSFAYSIGDAHPEFSVFWVPALSVESFEQAYGEIAKVVGIRSTANNNEDIKELVRQHLSASSAGKWVLFVDNADDTDILEGSETIVGLLDYLPESSSGLTVFTTRHLEIAQSLVGSDVVEMEKMGQEEAIGLLDRFMPGKDTFKDKATAMELLDELDYLPLAMNQAAAYMTVNKVSTSTYLRLLRSTEQDAIHILSKEIRDGTRYRRAASAVATTWIVSFKQITDRDPVAADLLRFMSCIEWKAIPHSILPDVQPEARMISAIGTLCSYSFLAERYDEKMYDMHRLVHLAVRIWEGNERRNETIVKAMSHLADVFPFDDYQNRETWREFLPHVARIRRDTVHQDVERKAQLCLRAGRCVRVDGKVQEAVSWLEESYNWRRDLPADHNDRLASQHHLAIAYQANGQVAEAIEMLEHVVEVEKTLLAEDHGDRLASQHSLAIAYLANGQVAEAIKMLEHVVEVRNALLTESHPSRLASQHELARAYKANGQVAEAVKMLEHVVEVRKALAENHPSRLASQHELARAYRANGQLAEAVEMLEHVVELKKALRADHPSRQVSQRALLAAYREAGHQEKAKRLQDMM